MTNRDFSHIIISPYLNFFGIQMAKRWGLTQITEKNINQHINTPAVVLGYHLNKVPKYKDLILKHKGPQIICWGGGGDLLKPNINFIKNRKYLTYSIGKSNAVKKALSENNINFLERYVPYKDYSPYKAIPLKKGIYCHVGWHNHPQARKRLGWETMVKPLIERYGNDLHYVPFIKGKCLISKRCLIYIKNVVFTLNLYL